MSTDNLNLNFGASNDGPLDVPRPVSFGEKLVGLNFNPSNDDKVYRAKRLCADLADLVQQHHEQEEVPILSDLLYNHTIGEILNAQMNVVKFLTLKY